ncbi:MAG TPA: amino acid adenylation domain-containing protein [Opitutus sp.]|nr:amino acid adenylation domain-containing protein [Opitutus sp.]
MTAPLSSHQERLWFIDQFETGNVYPAEPTYHNIPLLLQGRGRLGGGKLAAAWRTLVARHGALRTRIGAHASGQTVQTIGEADAAAAPWTEKHLGDVGAGEAIEAALADAARPFHLRTDALVRAGWWRFGPANAEEFVLAFTFHHLVCDKPSLRLLAEEFAALLRDGGAALAEPELHYADYSEWQRTLPAEALEPLLFYWKWQLRGRLAALELPSARPRPAVHTFTAARHAFAWDAATVQALRALAIREGVEPAAVALAAFQVLLHRYARQDEIVLGTSFSCRRQPGSERLVGPVANLAVLRQTLGGNPEFRALLREAAKTLADAREHQEMPFDPLVLALNPEKDMSRTALFDVLFGYDDAPAAPLDLGGGTSARVVDTNLGYGKYDLNLALQAQADGSVTGALVYNADFHDAWFIAQMMRHYTRLLATVAANPAAKIDDVVLLDAAEERQLLDGWNATQASAPREKTLHALFAEQVRRTPERVALTHGDEKLTYAELEARTNRLAQRLRKTGVGPDVLVGLYFERGVDLVVAILAILKAGGAYLPFDPLYPPDRIAFMLEDAQPRVLLTEPRHEAFCRGLKANEIVVVDEAALRDEPAAAPADATQPGHLAYCIYTSGSTGRPKGALIEHRQVVRLMINDRLPFAFGADDVWTLFHSCCFDFSVWEMYGALLYGGRLVIVPRAVAQDPAAFVELAARERVTVLNQTPTSFYNFAREALRPQAKPALGRSQGLALRTVIFGGEALLPLHLREFKAAHPATRLVNMYGITETTVHVTVTEVSDEDIATNRSNVGGPIPTTTTYLMDAQLRLVPAGVPGEICVGGEGVGRGYLRRDELTRQRFIANPYRPTERLYRSGDLARQLPDGKLIYLGRIDDQVQIRGFRVELGEIKTRLLTHPAIADVEVIARTLQGEALELVGYYVPKSEVSVTDLRRHIVAALPDYMVPSAFVPLPALPLTSNGKVDRRALPEPAALTGGGVDYVAPKTKTEESLAAIFGAVLRQERVGAKHSFFELGGHSLLATQLVSRVRETFGVDLPLRHVFEAPTVEAFAAVIDERGRSAPADASQTTAIGRAARRTRNPAAAEVSP